MGAKYFNNSSLTVKERAGEQEVQRGSQQGAVGVAARGDRLVLVLHEEVSKNISSWTDYDTRNVNSGKRAKATWHVGERMHRDSTYTPARTRYL